MLIVHGFPRGDRTVWLHDRAKTSQIMRNQLTRAVSYMIDHISIGEMWKITPFYFDKYYIISYKSIKIWICYWQFVLYVKCLFSYGYRFLGKL